MNIQRIFEKYYQPGTPLYNSVWPHSKLVAEKALKLAQAHPELNIDSDFVYEAAMLHDIGVYLTHAPSIYCTGEEPYIRHGIIGAELLRNEGYPKHALVADKFYSKSTPDQEKPFDKVRKSVAKYGDASLHRFDEMATLFL